MSIEAMKQALEALQHAVPKDTKQAREQFDAIQALRTAIQQAESEPVAVRNPFAERCYTMSESHLSGHRLIVGFEKLEDAQAAHEWVARCGRGDSTHPAPGVPDDVALDAERWRTFLATRPSNTHEVIIAAIDAAMLAASPTTTTQPKEPS